jgi:elongation factor P
MANTSDLSRGAFIRHNNELAVVLEYEHRTPGNLRAFFQVKMRNVKNGRLIEHRYRAGESIEFVRVETRKLQYLYKEADGYVCMDNQSFEQTNIPGHLFGDSEKFIKEGMEVTVSFDGDTPVMAELPPTVEFKVTYTEPGLRGDTATRTLKPAKLENGAEIRVPLFVNTDDNVKIDTRTGEYMERV